MPLPDLASKKYGIGNAKLTKLRAENATYAAAAKKANSPLEIAKQTVFGLPKAALDAGKDIAKGGAEFGLSAGEAPARLLIPSLHSKVVAPVTIPGLDALGPLQSFESKAAQAVQDGATPLDAVGKGTLDTIVNDPLGVAFKPLVLAGGVLAKVALKDRGGVMEVLKSLRNPAKAVEEVAARRDAEFAGKTLPERLAATGERKLPIQSDYTPRKLPVTGESVDTPITPSNRYTPANELPVIDAGSVPRDTSGLPTIKANATPGKSELTYEPVNHPKTLAAGPSTPVSRETSVISTETRSKAPEVTSNTPELTPNGTVETPSGQITQDASSVEANAPTGDVKASGLARGVEAAAVEKKLTSSFEGLSGYETINMKDQAEKATQIVHDDYARARRIAMGQEKAPEGLKDFSVYVALEKRAQAQGDVATLRDLATRSALNEESSGAAQTLRILAERDPESPVVAIADVIKAREARAARSGLKANPKAIKDEVKAAKEAIAKAPKEDWHSFIDSITC